MSTTIRDSRAAHTIASSRGVRRTFAGALALALGVGAAACDDGARSSDCAGVAEPTLSLQPTMVRVGGTIALEGAGGVGALTYDVVENVSGGVLEGSTYTAGSQPGVDVLRVVDAHCGRTRDAVLTVVGAFDATPHTAKVAPGRSVTIAVTGAFGTPTLSLVTNGTGATVDGLVYTAGSARGTDHLLVSDPASGATIDLVFEVPSRPSFFPTRVALPFGSSVPLEIVGGSGVVTWQSSGPTVVENGRIVAPKPWPASVLHGVDAVTGDTVDVVVEVLSRHLYSQPSLEPGGDGFGTSIAATSKGLGWAAVAGAPLSTAADPGAGRAVAFTSRWWLSGVDGTADPADGGRSVGAGVAFTDFDGDGTQDVVVGAPGLATPSTGDTAILASYASAPAACLGASRVTAGGAHVLRGGGGSDDFFYRKYQLVGGTEGAALGRVVAGGFDFDGDGRSDVLLGGATNVAIFRGRPYAGMTYQQNTLVCDAILDEALPAEPRAAVSLGDLDGDGCDEVAISYDDGTKAGVVVHFGFDVAGVRCAGRTSPSRVRLAEDPDTQAPYARFGRSVARAGRFLGPSGPELLAFSTDVAGGGSEIVLIPLATVAAARPVTGTTLLGLTRDSLAVASFHTRLAGDFGATVAGGFDATGDGVPDLAIGLPSSDFAGPEAGAVVVVAGGPSLASDHALADVWMVLAGDAAAPTRLGSAFAVAAPTPLSAPTLVLGAPGVGFVFVRAP